MQVSFGVQGFRIGILIWVIIGAISYWVLPWFALEYGLFDATMDEYWDTLGWKSHPFSMLTPVFLLLFIPIGWANWSRALQGRLLVIFALIATLLLAADFIIPNRSMGLGTGVIVMVLAALFSYGIARLGFLQGDVFISGTVTVVILIILVFVFYPVLQIFYKVAITKEGVFAPLQFFDIVTSLVLAG